MKARTVVLAQGDFPRKGGASERFLTAAKRVVACDGAATAYRRRFGRWPDVIVGDLDSLQNGKGAPCVVKVDDQDANDLTKALDYCAAQGWCDVVIVGAVGKREDHTLGNVFRALAAGVPIATDYGMFRPVCGTASFRSHRDAGVSVFAPDPDTKMTSRGLKWPLDGVRFENLFCATLNRTTAARFSVTSSRPVFVYVAF